MAKVGRPSDYTQELADKICHSIAEGNSMRTVCLGEDMPSLTSVFKWLREKEVFAQQYARATEERTEAMAEDILDIADDGTNDWMEINGRDVPDQEAIQRSKLRVEARKWIMSKMKPKKYGDKLDLTSDGKVLPTPIISLLNVPRNDSNTEDSKTQ